MVLVVMVLAVGWTQPQSNCANTINALEEQIAVQQKMLWDWAGLIRYGSENTELPKPKPDENRVVFIGGESRHQRISQLISELKSSKPLTTKKTSTPTNPPLNSGNPPWKKITGSTA